MHPVRFSLMLDLGAVLISLATASPVVAEEEAAHCPGKLETLNASYAGQLRDVGQKLCELACKDNTPPALKNHFEARIVRLDLLGEPAPAISGTEVQGHQVSLADLKGKVVLVDLRQSWYFRCAASIAACYPLAQKYHRQGVVILRVNVDPRCRDFRDAKTALDAAGRFHPREGVKWINLFDRRTAENVAKAYGVKEIPANFLISRNGKIDAVEQSSDALDRASLRALGSLTGGHSR